MEAPELTTFAKHDILSHEQIQNERGLQYIRANPLDIGDLGFKNCAYQKCLQEEKLAEKIK